MGREIGTRTPVANRADTYGQARAWNNIGTALGCLKRHTEAHAAHQAAL